MSQSKEQNKKRIALLTFHNGYNYGAALQAYALQEAVSELGFDCEYINYVNEHRRELYDMRCRFVKAVRNKNLRAAIVAVVGSPFMYMRGRKFKHFYSTKLKQTERVYSSSEEAKALNLQYDKFVVGSDQVWNYVNNGNDSAFLLDFVEDNSKKLSYSSSFGLRYIPEEYVDVYQKNLRSFERIAVREAKGVEIVKELTGRDAHLVVDPVFLLDMQKWSEFTQESNESPYVFVYTDTKSELQDFKDNFLEQKEYQYHLLMPTLSVGDLFKRNQRIRISMSPEKFLSEIKNAEFVVTDSFHCLAFCLIFHKKFCLIPSGNRGKDERLLNLLQISHLEDRMYKAGRKISVLDPIDYAKVDYDLSQHIDRSISYLKRALLDEEEIFEIIPDSATQSKYMCTDDRCTGCSACVNSCKIGAIAMVPDEKGFLMPVRDENRCIDCGHCHKVCQVFDVRKQEPNPGQEYWAVKNTDAIRQKSTSGGVFSAISDWIIGNDGVVVAAAFNKEHFRVEHIVAETYEERNEMRGTYYVQSDLGDIFQTVRTKLQSKKNVLFVGTPCQVEGLNKFLARKYENLYTCDIVCHGVPSPMVFQKFLEMLKEKGTVENFKFRDKALGWRGYTDSVVISGKAVKDKLWLQSFDNMFSHNIINRMSCSNCQFTNFHRAGDLSIGDYWGIEKNMPEFEDRLGVSLVLCNTEKGRWLFSELNCLEKRRLEKEQCSQHSLAGPTLASRSRNQAFTLLKREGYCAMAKRYGECNTAGYFKNLVRRMRRKKF